MVLRRIADAIDRRPKTGRERRAVLQIAARAFADQAPERKGRSGAVGVSGWDLAKLAHPAFWSMVLLGSRRDRFAMALLNQVHPDTTAVAPYVQEKRAAEQVLDGLGRIDPDSLLGFVEAAVMRFQPPGTSGAPLVPLDQAVEILQLALLRGAMISELRPDDLQVAWREAHPDQIEELGVGRAWKRAQGAAESLYVEWSQRRRQLGRRLI